jgi:hypothetical protein
MDMNMLIHRVSTNIYEYAGIQVPRFTPIIASNSVKSPRPWRDPKLFCVSKLATTIVYLRPASNLGHRLRWSSFFVERECCYS